MFSPDQPLLYTEGYWVGANMNTPVHPGFHIPNISLLSDPTQNYTLLRP